MSAERQELLNAAANAVGRGELEQAVQMLSGNMQSDWKGRRLAIDLHEQLISRCLRAIQVRSWQSAIEALRLLRDLEGESAQFERLRKEFVESADEWIILCLKDGRIEDADSAQSILRSTMVDSPTLQNAQESIFAIRSARKLAGLGRFAEAESQMEALLRSDRPWVETEVDRLKLAHAEAKKLLESLHQSSESGDWEGVVQKSDQLLALANRHPLAMQMKQRAVAELAAKGKHPRQVLEAPKKMATMLHPSNHARDAKETPVTATAVTPILWIDGVGGFALCDLNEVVIGQAVPGNSVDLMIVGDLSRRAAAIRKSGEDHLLQPLQTMFVNDAQIDRATLLRNGDVLSLGQRVSMRYYKPNRLSATARLEMLSRHRWQPSVDAILLLGDSCILGPGMASHILCPFWSNDVVLFRNRDQWMCRSSQPLEVDGKEIKDAVPLIRGKRIRGTDFSMTLE